MIYTGIELATFFIIYAWFGWIVEVSIVAVRDRRFRNKGFLNLPFCTMYGFMMVLLVVLWPSLAGHRVFQFIMCFAVFVIVQSLAETIIGRLCNYYKLSYEDITPYNGQWMNLLVAVLFAVGIWAMVELVHPFVYFLVSLTPNIVLIIINCVMLVALIGDFLLTLYSMSKHQKIKKLEDLQEKQQETQKDINERIYHRIWRRLEKAYPSIERKPELEKSYVFAKGICLDKLIWVFLSAALIGDLIETLYCYAIDGVWMSRSSVLYGPFSIVWGLGAVVLTVVLSRFQDKSDRYIFLVGALLGGAYEYVCSVFTEIFMGTVFWDYSEMPLNIGGRTNLLYMAFWGILSVVWIKNIYPKMSKLIEKLPPLQGKIITWIFIVFMICNALLSGMAMIRYTERQEGIEADGVIERFLDETYEDAHIEKVWPNMIITK